MPLRLSARLLILLATVLLAAGALAQAPQRPVRFIVDDWNLSLDLINQELTRPELSGDRAQALRKRLTTIRNEAMAAQAKTKAQLKPLRERAKTLGPPPGEDEPPELEAIAEERRKINEEIAGFAGRIKQAELIINRTGELDQVVKARSRGKQIETLLKPFPLPVAPGTVAAAVPEFVAHLTAIARSPLNWWRVLTPAQREDIVIYRFVLVVVLALAIGLGIRFALLRWFGRDPAIESPTYLRRLTAGVSEGLATGIVPALIFGGFLYRLTSEAAIVSGLFAEVVTTACAILIFLVLAFALPRAVLAPELPAWRMVHLTPRGARAINLNITFLAVVFSVDIFFTILHQSLGFSDSLLSLFELVVNTLEAGGVMALMRARLWLGEEAEAAGEAPPAQAEEEPARAMPAVAGPFWTGLRLLIGTVAAAAAATTLAGFANLGAYLSESLLASGVVVGVLFLLRGLCRELIGAGLRSGFVRDNLALRHTTRNLFKFWLRALLDLAIFGSGVFLILTLWGVPLGDMWAWTSETLQGIKIGNVTISITDIFTALVIFVVVLIITRMLQRVLSERVLPQTGLDVGLRHSLSAGFGYLGLIIAVSLGIAAIGLDLTNLALIFGALSVGIGFGLQSVVNNFVSGLILLIERPIKVGDWIVVGANEGYVRRIRLRATELETFQRASIVIPNAEIVSTAVINWTHRDRYGRVDVPIRVAFGSDVDRVKEVLMTCLRENRDVVAWPAPQVLFRRYGESALEFEARGFLANIEYIYQVQSELLIAIDKAFRAAGIEVPYPQRDLHLKDADRLRRALSAGPQADKSPAHRPPRLHKVEGGPGESEGEG